MSKPEGDSPSKPVGARTTFDWVFLSAATLGIWVAAGAFNQINNKLDNKMSRSEFSRWTADLARENSGKINVPLYFPPEPAMSDGGNK